MFIQTSKLPVGSRTECGGTKPRHYVVAYNFNDIKQNVIGNFLVQEITNSKYAEKFNQIYRQQKLISVTLDNVINLEFIEEFVK